MESVKVVYGPCTIIRRFKADQEEEYRNHIKFVKAFLAAVQPTVRTAKVRHYSLNAVTSEEFPFMIVTTGEEEAFMQITYGEGALAEKKNEIVMKEFGGWKAVTPHSSVMDTPSPGTSITSLDEFEKTKQKIALGRYSIAVIPLGMSEQAPKEKKKRRFGIF